MKKLFTILLLITFITTGLNGQEPKFGNVTMDEMNMTVYPQDTSAVALILLKKGETRFIHSELSGFQFEYTLQMKIKILKNEGLEFCNQEVSFYQENRTTGEKITGLNGTTYNLENGKITKTKLSKEFINDENVDEKWILRKFTMPAAKVGSVIEFKYTLVSDYFYDLRDFKFQSSAPTLYTSYQVTIPEYFYYNTNVQGYESIKTARKPVNESFNVNYRDDAGRLRSENFRCGAEELTFVGRNLSAIRNEPYLWTLNDYISMVSFELKQIKYPWTTVRNFSSSWENIDKELFSSSSFGGNLKRTGYFKDEVAKDISLENAKIIQNMVKSRVKWNEKNRVVPTNLKDALKDGLGSSADINFLLINALKAAGFEAYPVVLSTRSNGRLPMANPSATALNYVITALKIDTAFYFTDASAKYGDWNILPPKCMVPQARIMVNETRASWVDLTKVSSGFFIINNIMEFTDSGLLCKVTGIDRGNSAYSFRSNYYAQKNEAEYIEKIESQLSAEIENFKVTGADNPDEDVKVEFVLKKDIAGLGDEYIYFSPIVFKPFSENPFKNETRKFPVNFDYPEIYRQIINIHIPEGYVVEELPKSEKIVFGDNDDLSFTYRIANDPQKVSLQYVFQTNNLLILPTEYEALKDFFSKIVMKNSEQIVLKKIAK